MHPMFKRTVLIYLILHYSTYILVCHRCEMVSLSDPGVLLRETL